MGVCARPAAAKLRLLVADGDVALRYVRVMKSNQFEIIVNHRALHVKMPEKTLVYQLSTP